MRFIQTILILLSSSAAHASRCYLCSNIDVKDVISNIQDTGWRTWLSQAVSDPRIIECTDPFLLAGSSIEIWSQKSRM
uniref:Secreted protein n=1 Tax=Bursaphelenchus xylophilus TaxID=6326 RepID=A0A1I7STX8_BURXY